jgi:uncharacterized protein YkwD
MNQRKGQRTMHRTALHRIIALPLAAILLTLMLSAVAAAQDAPPLDPIPTPTGTSTALRPDAAPLRPDDAPLPDPTSTGAAPLRPDAVAGATAGSFAVYLPLVVTPEPYPPVNRQWELEFIRLLNEERARHGLHPLREHPLLTLAARRHAYDLGINKVPRGDCGGGRGHRGTDGTEPGDRVEWAGYPGHYNGEAVSCGSHEVYYAVQGLLNSPPHRAILLNPIPVEIGVGAHPVLDELGGYSTVMLSGTPRP